MYTLKEYLSEALIKHKISNYDSDNVVDFGLSVKWLKYNLAGNKLTDDESDYGYYYQWGSTIGYPDATKDKFSWETTPYIKSPSVSVFTKYVTSSKYGVVDNKKILEAMDDAVTALLGSKYRMPTQAEYKELYNHCGGKDSGSLSGTTSVLSTGVYWVKSNTTIDGVKYTNPGCLFVGQDITNRIFFPASGHYIGFFANDEGSNGNYWSSSLNSIYSYDAYCLNFNSSDVNPLHSNFRYYGFPIRGVKIK